MKWNHELVCGLWLLALSAAIGGDMLHAVEIIAHRGASSEAPENTLLAFANHGMVGELMRPDGGDADLVLNRLGQAGTDVGALAATLQREGAEAFVTSWKDLLSCLEAKSATLRDAALAGDRR